MALTFFAFVKLLTIPYHFRMKVSPSYYAIPKQLYHTSYSHLDSSRSSSLQTSPSFTLSHQSPSTITRPSELPNPVFIVRDLPRHNLAGSQAVHQQLKIKLQAHQYYSNNLSNDDAMAQIHQKLEQLSKRVNKNTEDIKSIKQKQKTNQPIVAFQAKFSEQMNRVQQRQALFNQECLLAIAKVKEEMSQLSAQMGNYEIDCSGVKFDEKAIIKVRNLIEDRVKQETAKVRLIIENQTNKLAHELRWLLSKESPTSVPLKSKLKYPFKAVKMTITQYIEAAKPSEDKKGRLSTRQSSESPRSGRFTFSSERVYHIDKEGYLLDEDNYYLLDEKERMIRLDAEMLSELKRQGLLRQ